MRFTLNGPFVPTKLLERLYFLFIAKNLRLVGRLYPLVGMICMLVNKNRLLDMKFYELIEKIYQKPMLRVGFHLLLWLLLFATRLYLNLISFNVYSGFSFSAQVELSMANTLLLALFYYLSIYIVVPNFFSKHRYLLGVLLILLMLIGYTAIDSAIESFLIQRCEVCLEALASHNSAYVTYLNRGFINIIFTRLFSLGTPLFLLFAFSIPIAIKFALQSFRERLHTLQLTKENLQLEFNFLRAQLNPHFLFNSMNNIYGLIIKGENETSAALVARLSEFLRYTQYESNEKSVPLDRELAMIRDYIELEKVRLNNTKVTLSITVDADDYELPPLLLMPLVENAFKYCGDDEDAFIDIFLDVTAAKLKFTIENSLGTNWPLPASGGIGLNNFRKRLDLYFFDKYWYEVSTSNHCYSASLIIDLP